MKAITRWRDTNLFDGNSRETVLPWYFHCLAAIVCTITLGLSLFMFSGEEANPFRKERPLAVWAKCAGITIGAWLVSLLPFPAGWIMCNAASFIGIKVTFQMPLWLTSLVFVINLILVQMAVWGLAFMVL